MRNYVLSFAVALALVFGLGFHSVDMIFVGPDQAEAQPGATVQPLYSPTAEPPVQVALRPAPEQVEILPVVPRDQVEPPATTHG